MEDPLADPPFAAVAHRFVAWRAAQPRPLELAWARAGFHLLFGPFDEPTLVVPTVALAARGALPFACLPAWAEGDPGLRAAMLGELREQWRGRPGWGPHAARLDRALAEVEAEEGAG